MPRVAKIDTVTTIGDHLASPVGVVSFPDDIEGGAGLAQPTQVFHRFLVTVADHPRCVTTALASNDPLA